MDGKGGVSTRESAATCPLVSLSFFLCRRLSYSLAPGATRSVLQIIIKVGDASWITVYTTHATQVRKQGAGGDLSRETDGSVQHKRVPCGEFGPNSSRNTFQYCRVALQWRRHPFTQNAGPENMLSKSFTNAVAEIDV